VNFVRNEFRSRSAAGTILGKIILRRFFFDYKSLPQRCGNGCVYCVAEHEFLIIRVELMRGIVLVFYDPNDSKARCLRRSLSTILSESQMREPHLPIGLPFPPTVLEIILLQSSRILIDLVQNNEILPPNLDHVLWRVRKCLSSGLVRLTRDK
jgi:hypothetical protein